MAAFGILAALRERDRSGRGAVRRRLDDRRRAVVAGDGRGAATSPTAARAARAAGWSSRAGCSATGRTACADGWVALGALEPKFWRALVPRRRARGSRRAPVRARRLDAHAEVEAVFASRTRDEWAAFDDEHDCCLEPVLDLDEALDSELVRGARDGRRARPARRRGAGAAARRAGQALAHAGRRRAGGRARAGRAHRRRAARGRLRGGRHRAPSTRRARSPGRPSRPPAASWHERRLLRPARRRPLRVQPHTAGPWDPAAQHAGPPAALLGRALETCDPREGTLLSRITFEILGPVPVAEVAVSARVVGRGGRSS